MSASCRVFFPATVSDSLCLHSFVKPADVLFNLVWYQSHCGRMLCAFASIRRRGGSPVMSIHASFGSHGAGRWRKQFGCCSTICLETWWCWCYPIISLKHVMLGLVCPSCFSSRWGLQIQKGWSHSGDHRWKDRGGGKILVRFGVCWLLWACT